MPIVTLTSDFGRNDYYLASLKGALLSKAQDLNLVDISHNVKHYDIVQGAFILRNSYKSFPPGTIHIISVHNFYQKDNTFLAIRYDDHYFIGPDNGVFSLLFKEKPLHIYELKKPAAGIFPLNALFAEAVGHIAAGLPLNELGELVDEIEERISFQPVIGKSQIKGSVIHIDHYENVVVNVKEELFERLRDKRKFAIYFKRSDSISTIAKSYTDVEVGQTLCWFNSAGLLEISVNAGKASTLLGLNLEDGIQIDFYD